jgi:hypothetical protein
MSTEDAPEVEDTTADVVDTEPEAEVAEGVEEDAPESEEVDAEESEEEPEAEADDEEGSFTNLNPNDLPKELRPAYREMRRDYTQKMQEVAELRKQAEPLTEWAGFFEAQGIDPASEDAPVEAFIALKEAFEAQGADVRELLDIEPEYDDADEGPDLSELAASDDPIAAGLARQNMALQQRIERLEQFTNGMTEAEQKAQRDAEATQHLSDQFDSIAEEMDMDKGSPEFQEYARELADMSRIDEDGTIDVLSVHDRIQKLTGVRREKVKQSKQAPKTPPAGSPGREDYDATDGDARRKHMLAIASR